jgi:hypothetical protein
MDGIVCGYTMPANLNLQVTTNKKMEEKHLRSWLDFENEIQDLEQLRNEKSRRTHARVANLYFRGQSNSCWKLETTWERYFGNKTKLIDYYKLILSVKNEIDSSKYKRAWNLPNLSEYAAWLETYISIGGGNGFPGYDYMSYLRHYGFPSPLLDWSKSPHIAAYFAFHDLNKELEKVAIYVYMEHIGVKGGRASEPNIITFEKDVNSHKRHSLQQSSYSICTSGEGNSAYYCCHEDVFSRGSKRHDFLWKFTLPYSEQIKVLNLLDTHGINEYSLFQSEESFLRAEFLRKVASEQIP